jgi:predicted small integral membrane protein
VIVRVSKFLLLMSMALLASLVSFGNLTDYGSNLAFMQHVFLMDTTCPDALRAQDDVEQRTALMA